MNGSGEGSYSQVIQGIEWCMDNGINIISMSLGGLSPSETLHEAIQKANSQGILIIASAGNYGMGEEKEAYPARYPEVLSIGAVDNTNTRASFSSTGSELDLVAPGVNIYSTTFDGNYGYMSGTSMAAPHVAGAAAAIWSKDTSLTNVQVKQKLLASATPLGATNEYGHGLVNVAKALGLESLVEPEIPSPSEESLSSELRKYESRISNILKILSYLKEKALESKNMELSTQLNEDSNQLVIGYQELLSNLEHLNKERTAEVNKENTELKMEAFFIENREAFLKLEQFYQERMNYYLQKLGLNLEDVNKEIKLFSGTTLELNQPIDVSLGQGDSQVYPFTPSVTGNYSIFTGPYGGIGSVNDTALEVFRDSRLQSLLIDADDDYGAIGDPSFFARISPVELTAGTTYYIKIRPADETCSVFARLTITHYLPEIKLLLDSPQDVNNLAGDEQVYIFTAPESGFYRISTTYYGNNPSEGESDTSLYAYYNSNLSGQIAYNNDANGSTFSTLDLNITKGSSVYIKLVGNNSFAVHARISVIKNQHEYQGLSTDAPIDVTVGQNQSKTFSFTPSVTGNYKIFTSSYANNGVSSDTYLYLYDDPVLTKLVAYNDDSNGTRFSTINYQLTAGKTYFITLKGYGGLAISARLTINQMSSNQYTYDAAGRLDYILMIDGKKLDFQYDLNGNLVKKVLINP